MRTRRRETFVTSRPVATYDSGEWMALVGGGVWLLADWQPNSDLVRDVWASLSDNSDPADARERLLDMADGASYAAVTCDGDTPSLMVAGSASIEVWSDGALFRFECPFGARTAEYRLKAVPDSVALSGGEVTECIRFPIDSGVARASALQLVWGREPTDAMAPASADASELVRSPLVGDREEPMAVVHQVRSSAPGEPASQEPRFPDEGIPSSAVETETLPPQVGAAWEWEPADSVSGDESIQGVTLTGPPEEEVDDPYAHLFGATINRSVEDAAIRSTGDDGAVPPRQMSQPIVEELRETNEQPGSRLRVPPSAPPAGGGVIDSVPWMSATDRPLAPSVSESSGVSSPLADAGEESELTISRAARDALLDSMSQSGSLMNMAPMILAVRCGEGHLNPPHADNCRICRRHIPDQSPFTAPRPVLGCLRLSTGGEVMLDRGVLMGRSPSPNRTVGDERPHIVKLPSPDHDISRNHLEIRLDGWHVMLVDLGSTNGTVITRPGSEPERLRPEHPTMIEPGTTVALADDVRFAYEVTE